jgi:hypothetical protein
MLEEAGRRLGVPGRHQVMTAGGAPHFIPKEIRT